MKKKYIITGIPLAGKSTLAQQIANKHKIAHIALDPIIYSFEQVFPKLGISHMGGEDEKGFKKIVANFRNFFCTYIDALEYENSGYVIEGFHVPLEEVVKKYNKTHTIMVVGYPNTIQEKKYKETRKNDEGNRTNEEDEMTLRKLITKFIKKSKKLQTYCKKNKIIFIDTSKDFKKVIKKYS